MFPYHVKTSKINVDETSKSEVSSTSEDQDQNFPHHNPNEGGNINFNSIGLRDLFTVKNKEGIYAIKDTENTYDNFKRDDLETSNKKVYIC